MPPLVTIVVCTRDRVSQLAACLASLRQQTWPEIEIIVVDNAPSRDSARQIAERFGARCLDEPRRGLSRARNTGARAATGTVVAFTDDDVIADEAWISSIVREFVDQRVGLVAGVVAAGGVWDFARSSRRVITRGDEDWFELANFGGIGNGANMAIRRTLFDSWLGFDERLGLGSILPGCEEHCAFFELIEAGHAAVALPDAIVRHSTIDAPERASQALTASAAYALFLFLTRPGLRRRIARYVVGALRGRRRAWRSGAAPRLTRGHRLLAMLRAPAMAFRAARAPRA